MQSSIEFVLLLEASGTKLVSHRLEEMLKLDGCYSD